MKIAIVNDIHIGPPLQLQGIMRAHSLLMEDALPKFLQYIAYKRRPDILVNLGDLIRSEEKEVDKVRYRKAIASFRKKDLPVLHLLGNHEIKRMSLQDVEGIWQEEGFQQKSYGYRDHGEITLIWIGLEYEQGTKNLFLPDEQLAWLKDVVSNLKKPAFLFTHCTLDRHDVRGNFFYELENPTDTSIFFLKNQAAVCSILSSSPYIQAVFQAHLHYFHAKWIDGIPYITCPAMGDNICAPSMQENNPEVYTLLFVDKEKITVKAYSRDFCFAGIDFKMR